MTNDPEGLELIFVSLENWDSIWRRNQFVCSEIARRFPKSKILFVGLSRDVSNGLRRLQFGALRSSSTAAIPGYPNIWFTQPLKLLPSTLAVGRRTNESMMRAHVRREAEKLGFSSPILWLNPHSAVHMVGRMSESAVVYDITDDWISLTQSDALRDLTTAQDRELCSRADAVIVCSEKLAQLKCGLARNLHLIPNGVDADHYSRVLNGKGPLPAITTAWRKPVFGYTGTIHPDRVDVNLIEAMARGLKEGSIALVGPSHLSAPDTLRLQATGRVSITGAAPYADIPDIMRAFDVCITPHRVTPFTESLNPIKLWEYLAGGKPIVSTNVAGFRDYPRFVRIANDTNEFIAAMQDALTEDSRIGSERRAEAEQHSWQSRVDRVLEVFDGAAERRAAL